MSSGRSASSLLGSNPKGFAIAARLPGVGLIEESRAHDVSIIIGEAAMF